MYSSNECLYALSHASRSIIAQAGSGERHRWLAGTCSLSSENEISILEYDEEGDTLNLAAQYCHPEQIWCMAANPNNAAQVVTSHISTTGKHSVSLWHMADQDAADITGNGDGHQQEEGHTQENDDDDSSPSPSLSATATATASSSSSARTAKFSSFNPDKQDLRKLCTLKDANSSLRPFANCLKWHGTEAGRILTAGSGKVLVQDVAEGRVVDTIEIDTRTDINTGTGEDIFNISSSSRSSNSRNNEMGVASWYPHNPHVCLSAHGNTVSSVDIRSCTITSTAQVCASGYNVKDIDCNPNTPGVFITCGDDRLVRFWDIRSVSKGPLKTLLGHSHWATTAKYNPYHDQLLLSGGSDNSVNLWRVASCSSAPWLGGIAIDGDKDSCTGTGIDSHRSRSSSRHSNTNTTATDDSDDDDSLSLDPPDIRIRTLDQHSDSIYSIAWSTADAWCFCSVSYDGRVMLNHVPSTEKYKILL